MSDQRVERQKIPQSTKSCDNPHGDIGKARMSPFRLAGEDVGEMDFDAAKAAVARIRTEIDHTLIRAPFDGVVEERFAEIGAYLKVGDNVATVIDRDPMLVVAHVSERDVGGLRPGARGSATLVTGERVSGKLRYVATRADPSTRTFRVELQVVNAQRHLRSGVTTELRLPVGQVTAHFLSPALLALDDEGVIGVRTVNADGVVEFHPAVIVADETDGVWLGGESAQRKRRRRSWR